MSLPTCPLCQSRLRVMYFRTSCSVECVGWNCAFRLDEINEDIILRAVIADHMRPLDEPHAYVANPDYAGCDAPTGNPVKACGRAPECHPPAKACDCHKPIEDAGPWALCNDCGERICPVCAEWFDHDMKNTGECHECAALSAAVGA